MPRAHHSDGTTPGDPLDAKTAAAVAEALRRQSTPSEDAAEQKLLDLLRQYDAPSETDVLDAVRGLRALRDGTCRRTEPSRTAAPPEPPSLSGGLEQAQPLNKPVREGAYLITPWRLSGAGSVAGSSPSLPRPFAFPSLGALDEAAQAALDLARDTDGLQPLTLDWMARGYRQFRAYLVEGKAEGKFLGGQPENQLPVLDGWIASMRKQGRSRVTINGNWRAVRGLFSRIGKTLGCWNPLAACPSPHPGRSEPSWLSKPEAERLVTWVQHAPWRSDLERTRNVLIVGLMLLAGLRRGEVLRLRYGDVNLDQKLIHIVKGKGRNGGKDRPAYMPPLLLRWYRDYLVERQKSGWTGPELLVSTRKLEPLRSTGIERLFQKASRGSGVRVHPHSLRHTFVTMCVQAGIPSRVIQLMSGHSSLAMVEYYSHVVSTEAQDAAERIVLDID